MAETADEVMAWCGHCNGKGYLNAWFRQIYGDCGNCGGSGKIALSEDQAAWMREHDPDRLIVAAHSSEDTDG